VGLVLAPLPDQGIAIDKMSAGPRHAKGGGKGVGAAAKQIFLARDDGHGAIRMILEDHLHVATGQVSQFAVAGNKVDAPFHLGQRHNPGRAKTVGFGRGLALVIPSAVQAARGDGTARLIIPKM